jgi:polyphosphate kinase
MAKKEILLNREISWLAFNGRVLQEAGDASVPLIERLRFLGIFSNNLDEFFRVRVATIKRTVGVKSVRKDTYEKPQKLLEEVQEKVILQQKEFEKIYAEITKQLNGKGVQIINEKQLNAAQKKYVKDYFQEHIRPALVPLMLNQVKDFPALRDRSIYLAIKLSSSTNTSDKEFSLLEVPTDSINRFVSIPHLPANSVLFC